MMENQDKIFHIQWFNVNSNPWRKSEYDFECTEYMGDDMGDYFTDDMMEEGMAKDFEPILEDLCLHDRAYKKRMKSALDFYEREGYVPFEYDGMLWDMLLKVTSTDRKRMLRMRVGESWTNGTVPLTVTRIQ